MNTKISYAYAVDGVKQSKSIILSGELNSSDIDDIARSLNQGNLFIPDEIGLARLSGESDNDHIWHQLDLSSVKPTLDRSNAPVTSAEFVDNFRGAIWDVTAATGRLYGCENINHKTHPSASLR